MPGLKTLNNLQIAELLRDVAAAYEYRDQNKYKFQIIAYERAADAVEHATSELKDLWDDGKLEEVPGIGPSIAEHLDEIFRTGKSKHFESLMKEIPKEAFKLMELPGIGIKTAMKLIKEAPRKEINEKLKEVEVKEKKSKRHLLPYAAMIASEVMDYLLKCSAVKRVDPLGSLRRQASTIGDIDLAVATDNALEVLEYFTKYPKSVKTIEKGDHTSSILFPGGVQVDLMTQPIESYGSLLQHFTGSKHHNIALRELALKKGLSLSEYGIRPIKNLKYVTSSAIKIKNFKDEISFYNFLGLDYIEPELREDTGEIEAAREHTLPKLVELKDIKADLQVHSDFDIETSHDLGESSMKEVVKKGNDLGYEYLALTEHNPSQKGHNDQQIIDILKRKQIVVEQLNYSLKNENTKSVRKVFNSLEIDMKSDGSLPVPDAGLSILDFALVSIHSNFDLPRDLQTKRVLSALSHPKARIFAHPTGRKLNEREGAELNWPEIFAFCLEHNKWIEINCDPMRLDLPDTLVREAVKLGVKLTFGTDAHHVDGMNNMMFGISVARRGWATKNDIINTRNLVDFEKLLKGGD
ncbi:MAG TPA: helix-hairpin-helix domain-containing protein [Candidatus Saccharimonadales bacterium]|jgi:DNA polymerase (family 10)|nr:helix-hairpin-helix domain-containing protein [Candidatus Saccharimonadales bacterium]